MNADHGITPVRVDGDELIAFDRRHIWHPYASAVGDAPLFPVVSAEGVRLRLADGRELVDGMASWWSAIHGYNHPALNQALRGQIDAMAHVMFGGLTHPPAVELCRRLVDLTPEPLQRVFLADSGSVSVEVALKMALQYQRARGRDGRTRMITVRGGYHGDTFAAMAVCDPDGGMHALWSGALPEHVFAPRPPAGFHRPLTAADTEELAALLAKHRDEVAALILEPIVQNTGGMQFHSPAYLRRVRELCDEHDVLMITDEIATGFGRTGEMFAVDHAGISPDIMCVGKAMTGGYLTMAAALCTDEVAETISRAHGAFMHGPTFMANPLAAAVSTANIDLLVSGPWRERIAGIADGLRAGLEPARGLPQVADVRVLGGIGVIELHEPVDMRVVQPAFVERGVWVRPFGRLVYTMPPYVMGADDLATVTAAMVDVVANVHPEPGAR